mgnify:CR=1 FL=1|jgi:hypothetical protein
MSDSTDKATRLQGGGAYLRLKAEFRGLCNAVGGYEAAADITRGTTATLHRHGDPKRLDLFPAVDAVLDLEMTTGKPLVTAFMAAAQGYRLEPMTRRAGTDEGPGLGVLSVMKEVGEFASAVHEMEADGDRSVNEIERAIREGQEAKEAIEQQLDTLFRLLADKQAALFGQGGAP